jgi:hypothetical protein
LAVFGCWKLADSGPKYRGVPLNELLPGLVRHPSSGSYQGAAVAVDELGGNIALELIALMERPIPRHVGWLTTQGDKLPSAVRNVLWKWFDPYQYTNCRQGAFVALRLLGPKAAWAAPEIVRRLEGASLPDQSKFGIILQWMGPEAIPAMLPELRESNSQVKEVLLRSLGGMGDAAAGAESALLEFLGHRDMEVAEAAAGALVMIGPRRDNLLAVSLWNQNPQARVLALRIFRQSLALESDEIPRLEALLTDADAVVRFEAALLMHCGTAPANLPKPREAVRILLSQQGNSLAEWPVDRRLAVVSALRNGLSSQDPETALQAAAALISLGEAGEGVDEVLDKVSTRLAGAGRTEWRVDAIRRHLNQGFLRPPKRKL